MTYVQELPVSDRPGRASPDAAQQSLGAAFFVALLAAFAAVLAISLPQLADPLVRFDDYPAYFGEEWMYYDKTLSEGRWLNYWWMSRETIWPGPVTFAAYQVAWAVFAAAAAANALGSAARRIDIALLTVLIVLSPQAYIISGWFNTLAPGLFLLAGFAVATLFLSVSAGRWLFLIAAPVSMLSYSTLPLLMMGLLLTRHGIRRSLAGLFGLMVLLAASIALGMVLMYTINWYYHGIFGLELASWRKPSPATDLEGLLRNAELLPAFAQRLFMNSGFGGVELGILNLALLLVALVALARRHPYEALYIIAGIAATIGLMVAHSLQSGVEIPVRSLVALWLFFCVAVVRALEFVLQAGRRTTAIAFLLILIGLYAGEIIKNVRFTNLWQSETQELASAIPQDATNLVVYGNILALDGAFRGGILHHYAMSLRMRQLTGLPAVNCGDPAIHCDHVPPFDTDDPQPGETLVEDVDGTVFIRLPKLPEGRKFPHE